MAENVNFGVICIEIILVVYVQEHCRTYEHKFILSTYLLHTGDVSGIYQALGTEQGTRRI